MSMARLIDRLWNWGVWSRSDPGGPTRSCIASFWAKWTSSTAWDSAGWGDPNPHDPGDVPEIDAEDAERIDAYVRSVSNGHRSALVRRYVHGHRPTSPSEMESLYAAQRALAEAMGETVTPTRYVRRLARGRA